MSAKLIALTLFAMTTAQPSSPAATTTAVIFQSYDACIVARDALRGEGKLMIGNSEFRSKTRAECFRDGEGAPGAPEAVIPPTRYDIIPAPGRGPNIRVPEQNGAGGPVPLSGPYRWPQDY